MMFANGIVVCEGSNQLVVVSLEKQQAYLRIEDCGLVEEDILYVFQHDCSWKVNQNARVNLPRVKELQYLGAKFQEGER